MYNLETINVDETPEDEIREILKKEKLKQKFCSRFCMCRDMDNLLVEAEYNWTSNASNEYVETAKLRVTYNEKEKLIIDYKEEGTKNGRYHPNIDLNFDISDGAKNDIIGETNLELADLEMDYQREIWRDIIKKILCKN